MVRTHALWYSAHRRPGQRLIVHLHRFELYRPWPRQAAIDLIDQVVCVSPHYARVALARTGWPPAKVTVVPNYVDIDQLDRPKLEGAVLHLGMIGIVPSLKRMDLALDVLALLRRDDPRYQLFVKGKLPWEHPAIWAVPAEREAFDDILRRMQLDPALRGAVTFDGFGTDVPSWLRRIGWVLSTSDGESFHLAPADGMASGAVPVIRDWPGADTIYDRRWIRHDPPAMADLIATIAAEDRWEMAGAEAKAEVRERYAVGVIADAWSRILEGDLPGMVVDPAEAPVIDAFANPSGPIQPHAEDLRDPLAGVAVPQRAAGARGGRRREDRARQRPRQPPGRCRPAGWCPGDRDRAARCSRAASGTAPRGRSSPPGCRRSR